MIHPLVVQLQFTRREFSRGLEGLSEEDATAHLGPMNCISWIVGHLAWHEQKTWLTRAQDKVLYPDLNTRFAYRAPMCTPSLAEALKMWREVTTATEEFLEGLTSEILLSDLLNKGKSVGQSYGSAMQRLIYHYWYHIGETQAIRQMLGNKNLAEYVGDIEKEAPYRPG